MVVRESVLLVRCNLGWHARMWGLEHADGEAADLRLDVDLALKVTHLPTHARVRVHEVNIASKARSHACRCDAMR
jgi:hypothetical protein